MTEPEVVECADVLVVAATFPLVHLCPFRDEVDEGEVTIRWRTDLGTLELHALAAWLDTFDEASISHEALTAHIASEVGRLFLPELVEVVTRWTTAGGTVEVRAGALPS